MPQFNFSDIIASSTTNITALSTYLFPLITIAFSVVAVVAVIRLIISLIMWVGTKLRGSFSSERHSTMHTQSRNPEWDV